MPPLPPPDPSRYPCLSTSCSVEMRREFDALASSYCQVAYVRIAPPRPAGAGVRTIINGLDCRADVVGLVGGLQIPMRSTSCIIVSKRVDANGVLANEWTPRVYVPTTPTGESCVVGINALGCIPDSLNLDDNSVIPGGLAVLLGSTDLTDASGCIGATVTTFSCGPLTYPKIKLSLKTDPATNNILECVQDKRVGVFVKENGCAIRLSKVNRDNLDPSLGMQLKADIVLSLATNNIASCSVDCDVVPGGEAIGTLHVGFKTDSKSMIFSREVHSCSLGRWELDAKLRLASIPAVVTSANIVGARLITVGAGGYYFNPEIAGSVNHAGNPTGLAMHDGVISASAGGNNLNINLSNGSTVRHAIAVIAMRAPHAEINIRTGLHYNIELSGFLDLIAIGQRFVFLDTRTGYTGGTWRKIESGYTEIILQPLVPNQTVTASMNLVLNKLTGSGALSPGDIQLGSYSIDGFVFTVGVDGMSGSGNPSTGAIPNTVAALA